MKKLLELIWKIVHALILIDVLGMLVIVILQIVGRLISQSLPWTEELTRYCFLWTINFGMTMGVLNASHASVTIAFSFFKNKRKILGIIRGAIYLCSCLIFFGVACYLNIGMTIRQFGNGEISPALGIKMFLVTMPLFICNILAIIATIQSLFLNEKTRKIILLENTETNEILENAKGAN
jgi:TRAP-type C4-dicarboxylate transport system permease small subunit